MPGLVPGIHVLHAAQQGVDGRDKPGHDGLPWISNTHASRPDTRADLVPVAPSPHPALNIACSPRDAMQGSL